MTKEEFKEFIGVPIHLHFRMGNDKQHGHLHKWTGYACYIETDRKGETRDIFFVVNNYDLPKKEFNTYKIKFEHITFVRVLNKEYYDSPTKDRMISYLGSITEKPGGSFNFIPEAETKKLISFIKAENIIREEEKEYVYKRKPLLNWRNNG